MNTTKGLLTVIVLCYGQNHLIEDALNSIFEQDYPLIELIVSEDGSNSFEKAPVINYIKNNAGSNIRSFQVIVNEKNKGTVGNINGALNYASGEYIKLIAADDTYPNEKVFSRQVSVLKSENYEIVVGNIVECDAKLQPLDIFGFSQLKIEELLANKKDALLKYVCLKNPRVLATQAICFKKSFFEKYGCFDERFRLVEDLPLAVKIAAENVKIGYDNSECVKHRGSVGISTSNNLFDNKRINYYKDLETYFKCILMPLSDRIGHKSYIKMRLSVATFRIKYCESTNSVQRLKLLLRYSLSLIEYAFFQRKRAKNYLNNIR